MKHFRAKSLSHNLTQSRDRTIYEHGYGDVKKRKCTSEFIKLSYMILTIKVLSQVTCRLVILLHMK